MRTSRDLDRAAGTALGDLPGRFRGLLSPVRRRVVDVELVSSLSAEAAIGALRSSARLRTPLAGSANALFLFPPTAVSGTVNAERVKVYLHTEGANNNMLRPILCGTVTSRGARGCVFRGRLRVAVGPRLFMAGWIAAVSAALIGGVVAEAIALVRHESLTRPLPAIAIPLVMTVFGGCFYVACARGAWQTHVPDLLQWIDDALGPTRPADAEQPYRPKRCGPR